MCKHSFICMLDNWASLSKEVVETHLLALNGKSTGAQQEENRGYSTMHSDSTQRTSWNRLLSLYTAQRD